MKKAAILFAGIWIASALSGCIARMPPERQDLAESPIQTGAPASDTTPADDDALTKIGQDRALEIALKHAGLSAADVFDVDAERDFEQGVYVWEVDFETKGYEYSYTIDMLSGTILRNEKEPD